MDEFVNEVWKAIEGFSHYEVSNYGRVRSGKTHRILKFSTTRLGYKHVVRQVNGRAKAIQVHRAVALAFLGLPIGDKKEVNHIDGNKANNNASNLQWVTRRENIKHAWANGLMHYVPRKSKKSPSPKRDVNAPTKRSTSGFRGVTKSLSRWKAAICIQRKSIYIGTFDTPEEAHEAYLQAKAEAGK